MSKAMNTRATVEVKDVRKAVADYIRSEGCTCCQNIEKHREHTAELGKLLDVPMYSDKSGYDFDQFSSNPV